MVDQFKTPIQAHHLPILLKKYTTCSSFTIEFIIDPITELNTPLQISEAIESFLKDCGIGRNALDEVRRDGRICEETEKDLFDELLRFIIANFGQKPKAAKMKEFWSELIEIFPQMRQEESEIGGIDKLNFMIQKKEIVSFTIN